MTTTPDQSASPGAAITVAQIGADQCWADPSALRRNSAKVEQWYRDHADDADLVVFPELILTGYIPLKGYDQAKKRVLSEVAARVVDQELPLLATATKGRRAAMIVGFMEPTSMRHEMHNSIALIQDGAILGVYRKMHLPVEENHYFVPGDEAVVVDCRAGRVRPEHLLRPRVPRSLPGSRPCRERKYFAFRRIGLRSRISSGSARCSLSPGRSSNRCTWYS